MKKILCSLILFLIMLYPLSVLSDVGLTVTNQCMAVSSTPSGIDCGATCSANFTAGSLVVLQATPGAGSVFVGWSGGGCSGTEACIVTMDADKTVSAIFNPIPVAPTPAGSYRLTIVKAGSGVGTVLSSPSGVVCGEVCSANYTSGKVVTLKPILGRGSVFSGWSGEASCSGLQACKVTMNKARSVVATFTKSGTNM